MILPFPFPGGPGGYNHGRELEPVKNQKEKMTYPWGPWRSFWSSHISTRSWTLIVVHAGPFCGAKPQKFMDSVRKYADRNILSMMMFGNALTQHDTLVEIQGSILSWGLWSRTRVRICEQNKKKETAYPWGTGRPCHISTRRWTYIVTGVRAGVDCQIATSSWTYIVTGFWTYHRRRFSTGAFRSTMLQMIR